MCSPRAVHIPYTVETMIHVCTGARVGHRLERAANMIIINFLLLLTIIDIHILTSLTYNSADLQACYLANWASGSELT